MARQPKFFGTDLDLQTNEIRNAVVQNLSSAPSSPTEGRVYYDTTLHMFGVYQNGAWAYHADKTFLLSRTNHTGSQTASTISDFDAQVRTSRLDQMAAPTANVSLNSNKITNLTDPTAAQDAATKNYVDLLAQGITDQKAPVRIIATTNVALSGLQTIDGVTPLAGDRIAVIGQSTGSQNGIYIAASGAWPRSTDANTTGQIIEGTIFLVNEGTVNAGATYRCTTSGTITIGTTATTWLQFNQTQTYTAGNGLQLTGSSFSVKSDTGITTSASGAAVDHTKVPFLYSAAFGDGASQAFTINHALGTRNVIAQIFRNSGSFEQVEFDVQHTDTNNLTINVNGITPSSNQFQIVVHG